MLFQYGTLFHIGTQHAETCFIKGSETHTSLKLVPFWNTRQKTTVNGPLTPQPARIPRTALTDEVIPDNDKNIFTDWHDSCLCLSMKCKPNPLMLVASCTKYRGLLALPHKLLQKTLFLAIRFFELFVYNLERRAILIHVFLHKGES